MPIDLGKLAKGLLPILGSVAPTVASFIPGGPTVLAVLDTLGVSLGGKTEDQVLAEAEVAVNTPEGRAHVLAMEQEFTKQRAQDLQNVDSARTKTKDIEFASPHFVLAAIVTTLFAACLVGIVFFSGKIDPTAEKFVLFGLGILSTETARVLNFFFGSSLGSKRKTDIMANGKG